MAYTGERLDMALQHINLPRSQNPTGHLALLKRLQAHQLVSVPFESTSLHYSPHRQLSLDLDDLFQKIVVDRKGGYCMELNAFFGAVLRGLGFNLINCGARVKIGERYNGWDHMVNLVSVDGQRYLVDVGFGAHGPMQPAPLVSGTEFSTISPVRGKLEYRNLSQHTDPSQRVWVYSTLGDPQAEWIERYCFTETEFFAEDFTVMNLSTMTLPTSYFVQTVLAMRAITDVAGDTVVGIWTLHKNELKQRLGDKVVTSEMLKNEEQRVGALAKYFGIVLKQREIDAIKGLASELRES